MNVYQTCYDLINQYIYGNTIVSGSYQELVCIAVSTVVCIAVFALPFVIVWHIIRTFI